MSELELADHIIAHALRLQQLSASQEAEADAILAQLEQELRALLATQELDSPTKRAVEQLVKQADDAIAARYADAAGVVDTHGLTVLVADNTQALMQQAFGSVRTLSAERIASLSTNVLVYGSPAADWWAKQSEDTAFRFAAQVRQGVANGETQERIVGRIVGRRGEPGVLDLSRRNARALVHSTVMAAANHARLAVYRKNMKHARGMQWLATLDSHVCWTAETPILMADGTWKPAGEIRVNDAVIGGVTGEPCRVIIANKRLAQSSVVIHLDGQRIGAVTHDHPFLTPQGWRDAGRISLSTDVSEREVLCRHRVEPAAQVSAARTVGGEREALRDQQRLAEARQADNANYGDGGKLRDGLRLGATVCAGAQLEGSERLQHDGWRGGDCRARGGDLGGKGAQAIEAVLGGRGISRENAGCAEAGRSEGGHHPARLVSDAGRPSLNRREDEQPEVACCDCREEPGACSGAAVSGVEPPEHQAALGRPGAAREDERSARSSSGGTQGQQSRMGEDASREDGRSDARQVARPRIFGEDEGAKTARVVAGEPQAGCCQAIGDYEGAPFGIGPEILGYPEGVTVGVLTGEAQDSPVEVVTLSIEGDPTYIAGGIIVHNCATCAALDGSAWDFDGNPLDGTTLEWKEPPAHWSCRCVLSPLPKSLNELLGMPGLDEMLGQTRASANGPISGDTSMTGFLKRNPAIAEEILGAKRVALFQSGKLTLRDFVSGTGRPLTLAELGAR